MEKKREVEKRRKAFLGERKREWSDFLGEKKSSIRRGFFVTFGFCCCHMSFISFKMEDNARLQDWREAGPI